MRNIYIKSAIISMIILYATIFLLEIEFNSTLAIAIALTSLVLNFYTAHFKIKKLITQFSVFGDNLAQDDNEIQINKSLTNMAKLNELNNNVISHPLLNDRDIEVFEDVTNTLRMNIQVIDNCMVESGTVRKIMEDTGGEKALNIMFTTLLNEPERLTDVGDFAYANVPYLSRLIQLHVETELQEFKNDRTHKLLKESEEAIQTLAEEIVNNYLQYKNKDLDELEVYIRQSNQLVDLKRKRKEL